MMYTSKRQTGVTHDIKILYKIAVLKFSASLLTKQAGFLFVNIKNEQKEKYRSTK